MLPRLGVEAEVVDELPECVRGGGVEGNHAGRPAPFCDDRLVVGVEDDWRRAAPGIRAGVVVSDFEE